MLGAVEWEITKESGQRKAVLRSLLLAFSKLLSRPAGRLNANLYCVSVQEER